MNSPRNLVVLSILALAVVGGYFIWGQPASQNDDVAGKADGAKAKAAVMVEAAGATLQDMDTIIEAVGTTRAIRSVEISPLSSGVITRVNLQSGAMVEEGALLLELDSDIQRADLAEAEAKLAEAASALKRSNILKKSSAVAEAAVDRLKADVDIAQANRDRAAKRLSDRVVRAPFAGHVSFSDLEPGALVKEGDVIAILDDLSAIELEFSVSEGLFGRLKVGDRIQAQAAAFPDRIFEGEVSALDTRIDKVSRAFKVRGLIINQDQALPAGMFVHISVILDASPALAIPEEAVIVDGSRAFVFALGPSDNEKLQRVQRRSVTLGRRTFGSVEIVEGLQEGEDVVIRGIQKVRDGALVRVSRPKAKEE